VHQLGQEGLSIAYRRAIAPRLGMD